MKHEIKNKEGRLMYSGEAESFKDFVKRLIKDGKSLYRADLYKKDLSGLNFSNKNLEQTDFTFSNLKGANFSGAYIPCTLFRSTILVNANFINTTLNYTHFSSAYLGNANFTGSDLSHVCFYDAELYKTKLTNTCLHMADFTKACLDCTDFDNANLYDTNFINARRIRKAKNIKFAFFPSIKFLSSVNLGRLSDKLTLELMRRDAYAHPHPERFDEWAKPKGYDPYYDDYEHCDEKNNNHDGTGTYEFWNYRRKKSIWKPGNPQIIDRDLIKMICKEMGWKIK